MQRNHNSTIPIEFAPLAILLAIETTMTLMLGAKHQRTIIRSVV